MKTKQQRGGKRMEKNIALEFVRVTEAAARQAAQWIGRGDKHAADAAAVSAMRKEFDFIDIDGTVVIGEGERDEAPMLFIGEHVGSGQGPKFDIAVDPLECTDRTAEGGENAMAVIAGGPPGSLLHAPDAYMWKIAVGPAAREVIDLRESPTWNLRKISEALSKPTRDLVVVVLKRDRHEKLVEEIRTTEARIHFIQDGDVAGAIATALPDSPVDVLMGIGAAPEGVLAAAALRCMGGEILGKLQWKDDEQKARAKKMGIADLDRIYTAQDLASGDDVIFAATGVTDGDLLKGVRTTSHGDVTYSIMGRSASGTIRFMKTQHQFGKNNH